MTRSAYKVPHTALALKRSDTLKKAAFLEVYQRSSTILPEMIGRSVKVHTGQNFVKLQISEHTVGFKYGEFAPTKKRALYKKKKKR
jgi:small subunit ribosomal protein S19